VFETCLRNKLSVAIFRVDLAQNRLLCLTFSLQVTRGPTLIIRHPRNCSRASSAIWATRSVRGSLVGEARRRRCVSWTRRTLNWDLLNCGALVAWSEEAPVPGGNEAGWNYIQHQLCPQKTTNPPPHHEWRTIFSPGDLKGKTLATLEGIRLRLLQSMLLPGSKTSVRKAEDPTVVISAAAEGIRLETAPQLVSTAPPKPN
jgi:hypothetical protein